MIAPLLKTLLLSGSQLTLAVSPDGQAPARISCPLHAVTRLSFPEPLRELRLAKTERISLGVRIVASSPRAVIEVAPAAHPRRARLRFRGPTSSFEVELETAASGSGAEIDLVRALTTPQPTPVSPLPGEAGAPLPSTPAPVPPAETTTEVAPASPGPPPSPETAAEPTPGRAPVVFDLSSLLRATPVNIGRREGLPGQPPMVLVDALRGEAFVWLRFTLERGAAERVSAVSWEQGAIAAFTQEPVGRDLRVVVQLPRVQVSRKTRIVLETASGGRYRFALNSGTLAGFFRSLFE
ncbi:MAG TPA: hypothetical protein VJU18_10895 [Vicinamibacteria bacterium]|nr:hypothetical protein [Vicinamibacteria bacterium]